MCASPSKRDELHLPIYVESGKSADLLPQFPPPILRPMLSEAVEIEFPGQLLQASHLLLTSLQVPLLQVTEGEVDDLSLAVRPQLLSPPEPPTNLP